MRGSPYFVWVAKGFVPEEKAQLINEQIEAIDPSMSFVRCSVRGSDTNGWLERPNDGTNDHNHVRERSARCVAIAQWILTPPTKEAKKKAAR